MKEIGKTTHFMELATSRIHGVNMWENFVMVTKRVLVSCYIVQEKRMKIINTMDIGMMENVMERVYIETCGL
eukprot:12725836-Ditylum_brightwellii.AAC.1